MNGQRLVAFLAVLSSIFACGAEEERGRATAAACPDGSKLTYDADIAPIMSSYCVTCHATTVPDSQRHGAPTDHNFDSLLGLLEEADHVDQEAGSNGTTTNTKMPPRGYPAPTLQQRMMLSEWLACNAPANAPHDD
ncbi:MAG: uncharacterized protein JWN04_1356 [Myxococcaceae bacterium]|nr:uncharacterized protein [Myxococcaceae bacterium]